MSYNWGQCVPDQYLDDPEAQTRFFVVQNQIAFLSEVLFILGIAYLAFKLKHIPKEFNIMNELFAICWIRTLTTSLRYVLIFEFFNSDMLQRGTLLYVATFLDASCAIVTGLVPLLMTY